MNITTPGSSSSRSRSSYIRIVAMQLACVSTQPFGGPVVPEV